MFYNLNPFRPVSYITLRDKEESRHTVDIKIVILKGKFLNFYLYVRIKGQFQSTHFI